MRFHRRRPSILGNTPVKDTALPSQNQEGTQMGITTVSSEGGAVATDTAIYLTSRDLVIKASTGANLYIRFQGRNLTEILTKALSFCAKRTPPWIPTKIRVMEYGK